MKTTFARVGAALLLLSCLTACPELRAFNDQLEAGFNQYPGGPLGFAVDSAIATNQPAPPRRR